mgnify:CR=1 FL=1
MKILILGSNTDAHVAHIQSRLQEFSVDVECWETHFFPQKTRLSMDVDRNDGTIEFDSGKRWKWSEIHSVYWRTFSGVDVPPLSDREQYRIAVGDANSTLRSFMQACPARWVNPWAAYRFHQEKPLQLKKARQIGIPIPRTSITNSPDEVIAFCSEGGERIIFKPVYGGTHTQFVTLNHLERERLSYALSYSPVTLQEYIPGTNIRSYVIGEEVYSAEISSSEVDFRSDRQTELRPKNVPESVKEQCRKIAQEFGMEWTAIDWRLKPTGEYIFLEANFSPMFVHFERETGFPIGEKLAELLMR